MKCEYCRACDPAGDLMFSQEVHHRHISQCWKFQGILEFINCQLDASSMVFQSQPARGKQRPYSVANVFVSSTDV